MGRDKTQSVTFTQLGIGSRRGSDQNHGWMVLVLVLVVVVDLDVVGDGEKDWACNNLRPWHWMAADTKGRGQIGPASAMRAKIGSRSQRIK